MSLGDSQDKKMTDAEFRMFSELLRGRSGLHFDEDSRFLVEKRVIRRVEATDVGSFAAYHFLLRSGSDGEEEFATLIDCLTTNETYFFREARQLGALIHEVIPELIESRRRKGARGPITIWSAGCSSGEEAYSVVMLAKEVGLIPGVDLRIYASDISRPMLTKSRRGVYREVSFRETSDRLRDKYFQAKDGQFRISDEIKRCVDFIHLNLVDREKTALLGAMDVILCRNVIIYFDLETKKRVMESFCEKLRPGGYLLLGHSESLINVTSAFALRHLKRDLVYRKPIPGEEAPDPWHELARAAVSDVNGREGSE